MDDRWRVGHIVRNAFHDFSRSWTILVLVSTSLTALFYGITLTVHALDVADLGANSLTNETLITLVRGTGAALLVFIQVGSSMALARVSLIAARGQRVRLKHMIVSPKHVFSMIAVLILSLPIAVAVTFAFVSLFTVLAMTFVDATSAGTASPAEPIFSVVTPALASLFGVPIAIYMTGFGLAQFFIIDRDYGPIAAWKAAWVACTGRRGSVVLYTFVAMAIMLAGLLCCCVGVVASVPLAMLGFAGIYLRSTVAPTGIV